MLYSHHHFTHHLRFTEVRRLYWARMLGAAAGGLVAIFIPLYFLGLGYEFREVLLYYVAYAVSNIAVCYPMMRLMVRIGPNRSMALGNLLLLPLFVGLITLDTHHWPLAALAFLAALSNEAYFPALHGNFSASETPGKDGRQVGMLSALTAFGGALSPAIGGFVAQAYGISFNYGLAAGLFVLAAVPLLLAKEAVQEHDLSLKQLKGQRLLRDGVANAGFAVVMLTDAVLWPILVYLLVKNYAVVGGLGSILVISSIATALYVGRREESKGVKHYLHRGSITLGLLNALRIFATSAGHVFGLNLLGGMGNQLAGTTFMTRFYENANASARLAYIRLMEYAWFTGWGLAALLLYGLTFFLPTSAVLTAGLLLAIPASFLMSRIR
ncbi:MAG TPA: MFS transporter [Patescibacteria group bacterium]|jgi:MFS family permease